MSRAVSLVTKRCMERIHQLEGFTLILVHITFVYNMHAPQTPSVVESLPIKIHIASVICALGVQIVWALCCLPFHMWACTLEVRRPTLLTVVLGVALYLISFFTLKNASQICLLVFN